jgi:NADPH:quinone reductase-like Zn-dependent oxidoreductase
MKAFIYFEYGSPDVLQLIEVAKPTLKDDEVLVKVHAASVNPLDWHLMRGEPFLARLENGIQRPKNTRLGADVAGVVESVGSKVTQFKPGDEVFGTVFRTGLGGFAEYVAVPVNTLEPKPANLSFVEAAAVPIAALTALQGLKDAGNIQAGQTVLVNGGSGGVGSFAVQLAKAFGTEVTAVCSTRNVDMVRSLGADHIIDYTREDFTRNGQRYDLIFDAVGNHTIADYARALNPTGVCAVAGFTSLRLTFSVMLFGALVSRFRTKKIGMMPTVEPNKKDLITLNELLSAGKIAPIIDRCYPFAETAEAIRYLETSRARGKVVVTVI